MAFKKKTSVVRYHSFYYWIHSTQTNICYFFQNFLMDFISIVFNFNGIALFECLPTSSKINFDLLQFQLRTLTSKSNLYRGALISERKNLHSLTDRRQAVFELRPICHWPAFILDILLSVPTHLPDNKAIRKIV